MNAISYFWKIRTLSQVIFQRYERYHKLFFKDMNPTTSYFSKIWTLFQRYERYHKLFLKDMNAITSYFWKIWTLSQVIFERYEPYHKLFLKDMNAITSYFWKIWTLSQVIFERHERYHKLFLKAFDHKCGIAASYDISLQKNCFGKLLLFGKFWKSFRRTSGIIRKVLCC